MSITLIIGPMYSGKSTTLLTYEKKFKACNKSYILINHSFDTRYTEDGNICTHDGIKCLGNSYTCESLFTLLENGEIIDKINNTDCIIIDEGQFFEELEEFCTFLAESGKNIVVAGLSGNYKKEPFDSISDLMACADKIIQLVSNCSVCGADAPFTKRISDEKEDIVVGGSDKYEPRCRKCF